MCVCVCYISRRAGHLVVGVGGECRAMEVRREDKGKGRTVRKRKKSQSTEEDLVSTEEQNTAKIMLTWLDTLLCVSFNPAS